MLNYLFIHYAEHEYSTVAHNLLLGFPTDCSAWKLRWRHPWHSSTQTPIIHPPESGKSLNVKLLEIYYQKLLMSVTIMSFFRFQGCSIFSQMFRPFPESLWTSVINKYPLLQAFKESLNIRNLVKNCNLKKNADRCFLQYPFLFIRIMSVDWDDSEHFFHDETGMNWCQ